MWVPAILHITAVDAGSAVGDDGALSQPLPSVVVDIFEVKGMDVTGDITTYEVDKLVSCVLPQCCPEDL